MLCLPKFCWSTLSLPFCIYSPCVSTGFIMNKQVNNLPFVFQVGWSLQSMVSYILTTLIMDSIMTFAAHSFCSQQLTLMTITTRRHRELWFSECALAVRNNNSKLPSCLVQLQLQCLSTSSALSIDGNSILRYADVVVHSELGIRLRCEFIVAN